MGNGQQTEVENFLLNRHENLLEINILLCTGMNVYGIGSITLKWQFILILLSMTGCQQNTK